MRSGALRWVRHKAGPRCRGRRVPGHVHWHGLGPLGHSAPAPPPPPRGMHQKEGGVWNPNVCAPKMAHIDFSFGNFQFFPTLKSGSRGGRGSQQGYTPPPPAVVSRSNTSPGATIPHIRVYPRALSAHCGAPSPPPPQPTKGRRWPAETHFRNTRDTPFATGTQSRGGDGHKSAPQGPGCEQHRPTPTPGTPRSFT